MTFDLSKCKHDSATGFLMCQTRHGRPVRIYATDGGGKWQIHGAILMDGGWHNFHWTLKGAFLSHSDDPYYCCCDLINPPERFERELWLNVYPNGTFKDSGGVRVSVSKQDADSSAAYSPARIDCELQLQMEAGPQEPQVRMRRACLGLPGPWSQDKRLGLWACQLLVQINLSTSTERNPEMIRPVGNKILVRPDKEAKTKGGIHLPDQREINFGTGTVMAIGTGQVLETGERVMPDFKAGDRIIYSYYAVVKDVEGLDGMHLMEQGNAYAIIA